MKHHLFVVLVAVAAWSGLADGQQAGDRGALHRSLPRAADLPSSYRPIGSLADRGTFYAAGGLSHRIDDGDVHHGLPATTAWGAKPKDKRAQAQGVLYGVADGRITSAGYLLRQADLIAGKSFHGLTLRELAFPAARAMTVDLVKGSTDGDNQYLFLWHFNAAADRMRRMLSYGELPPLMSLPARFTVVPNTAFPNDFYPRMGRHRRDFSTPANRQPAGQGDDSVWYGEAAGRLIFIEYIFDQQALASGAAWPSLPLDGVPIPPIDNVHILHYNGAKPGAPGLYTVHMYFIPETTYLAWEAEPPVL
jgi:hypothetical protein